MKCFNKDLYNEVMNAMEIQYIKDYDSYNNGYNSTIGGDGAVGLVFSEEHKRKMSESFKGRVISEETRMKISESLKGKVLSEETRRKLSESNKGRVRGENTRKKISEALKGGNNCIAKCVIMLDLVTEEELLTFESLSDAARYIGSKNPPNISRCVTSRQKSTYGYKWKYKD